jgi:hypothetical protein
MAKIMPEHQNTEYKQSWNDEYLQWVCVNAQGGTHRFLNAFAPAVADLVFRLSGHSAPQHGWRTLHSHAVASAHFAHQDICFTKPLSGLVKCRKQPERYVKRKIRNFPEKPCYVTFLSQYEHSEKNKTALNCLDSFGCM